MSAVQVMVCTPLCQVGMPRSVSAFGVCRVSASPIQKLWSKPAVLSTSNSTVSPGMSSIWDTCAPEVSVNWSAALACSSIRRGSSGVPPAAGGVVVVVSVVAVSVAAPVDELSVAAVRPAGAFQQVRLDPGVAQDDPALGPRDVLDQPERQRRVVVEERFGVVPDLCPDLEEAEGTLTGRAIAHHAAGTRARPCQPVAMVSPALGSAGGWSFSTSWR